MLGFESQFHSHQLCGLGSLLGCASPLSPLLCDIEIVIFDNDIVFLLLFFLLRQGSLIKSWLSWNLLLVDQSGFELIEICLPLPPGCWD